MNNQKLLKELSKLIGKKPTFRNIKSNKRPIGFSKDSIPEVSEGYAVSEKADGLNVLLITDSENTIFIGLTENVYKINLSDKALKCFTSLTVMECEYFEEHNTFSVFDVIVLNGVNIANKTFTQRYKAVKSIIKGLEFSDGMFMKQFYFPRKKTKIFNYAIMILKKRFKYETDGIIFMPTKNMYYDKSVKIYKWKPQENITVDFLCSKVRSELDIKDTYNVLVGINPYDFSKQKLYNLPWFKSFKKPRSKYFPILFRPKKEWPKSHVMIGKIEGYDSLDDLIIECRWSGDHWTPVLVRDDKTVAYHKCKKENKFMGANNWKVAIATLKEAMDPVSKADFAKLYKA